MKRTIALSMVVLCPSLIVLFVLFLCTNAPFSMLHRRGIEFEWSELERRTLTIWSLMMMPLYMALESALVAGLDHADNQWKSLFARPIPRWNFYAAKEILVVAATAASSVILLLGIVLSGMILPRLNPELIFAGPIPWQTLTLDIARSAALMLLALSIQHWVSMRWRAFSVAIGTGIVATVTGFFASLAGRQIGGWPRYFPWSLPILVLDPQRPNLAATLWVCTALTGVVTILGCWDFCRREVQ